MASEAPRRDDCVFCKIVAGEIPSHSLLDEEEVFAFLDIGPLSRGHTLLIPKGHYETVDALPEATAAACGRLLPRLSRALLAATGARAWPTSDLPGARVAAGRRMRSSCFWRAPHRPRHWADPTSGRGSAMIWCGR